MGAKRPESLVLELKKTIDTQEHHNGKDLLYYVFM